MTKTQANEPGFVLAPCPFCGCTDISNKDDGHEGWFECDWCHATSGYDPAPELEEQPESFHWNRRAAAPIVPAPAYGVKALEWEQPSKATNGCWVAKTEFGNYSAINEDGWYVTIEDAPWGKSFEWSSEDLQKNTLDTAKAAAQADFERRILSCLSSVPVEEADAKVGEIIAQTVTNDQIAAVLLQTPTRTLEQDAQLRQYLARHATPSEPEAKGEAGAGPVGEAVAGAVASSVAGMVDEWYRHAVFNDTPAIPAGLIQRRLDRYARPVEEPGEVERLAGRVAMQAHDIETFWKPQFDEQVTRAEIAEAALADAWAVFGDRHELSLADEIRALMRRNAQKATDLAETRERLEKVAVAACLRLDWSEAGEPIKWHMVQNAFAEAVRAALSTQESSAALAGDGKERGR